MVGQHGVVVIHHRFRLAFHGQFAGIEQDGAVADGLDGALVVGDDEQRGALLAELADAVEALVLEIGVAHRERFVDDQYIRAVRGGDAEGQAHLHAAGVHAHRLVDIVADFGKGFDFRHQAGDFFDAVAEQLPGHEGVLPAGEIGVEAHAEFEQRSHAAGDVHAAGGGLGGAGDHLEQGALAGAVDADDADRLAGVDGEVDVLQHPLEAVAWLVAVARPIPPAATSGWGIVCRPCRGW